MGAFAAFAAVPEGSLTDDTSLMCKLSAAKAMSALIGGVGITEPVVAVAHCA
jgi:hypothetical protein